MMNRQDSYIDLLKDKVEELLQLASSLKNSNELLTRELNELRLKEAMTPEAPAVAANDEGERTDELEDELKQLKKENKSLKEKNKLIQNKAERLVTKLNELGL